MEKKLLSIVLAIGFTSSTLVTKDTIYLEFPIPKSGTHLLAKTMRLAAKKKMFFAGRIVTEEELINRIDHLSSKQFLVAHQTYSASLENYLQQKGRYKILFMYRDPRDQIISFAHFIHKYPELWPTLQELSMDDLILYLIKNHNYADHGLSIYTTAQELYSIDAFYRAFLPWKDGKLDCCAVCFEDLIGLQGGGDYQKQYDTIQRIATFMNCQLTRKETDTIIENLFGGTYSFREGKLGEWKKYFNQQHKEEFKKVAGQLLIDLGYETNFAW